MSKKSKSNLATVDKRVRARQSVWMEHEIEALEADLAKLPDRAEQVELVDVVQPALAVAEPAPDGTVSEEGELAAGADESPQAEGTGS